MIWSRTIPSARLCWLALPLGMLLLTGCNSGDDNMGTIVGKVTVDGQAAQKGSITFTPVDGLSPTAGGKIEGGDYEVDVPVGVSKVVIRVPVKVGERKKYNTPDSPTTPQFEESLPAKYNDQTELQVEITPGSKEYNFDLSSK